jgi:4-amino-4-deoxy-L-arabinose transferase-like glycosyltransferase
VRDLITIGLRDRATSLALVFAVLAQIALAFAFQLSPDEAHYALYAQHLALSYFDHPPLVGWVQWPWSAWGGSDALMRLVPLACWLLAGLGVAGLAQTLYASAAVARAALWLWLLSPLGHLLGLALVPDTLLLPIICAVMYFCWRLTDVRQLPRLALWLGLGLFLGLAGLSKYTAVLLALGAALTLLLAHGPHLLTRPGPWIAVALAALLISPVLLWNASHQWISLAYQFSHAAGRDEWQLGRVGLFALVQVLGYGLLLVVGLVGAWRRQGDPGDAGPVRPRPGVSPLVFCSCFGMPTLLLLLYLSGRGSTLPHWAAPAWVALTPAAAAGCHALWQGRRKLLLGLGVFQALSCLALAGLMLTAGIGTETGEQAHSRPGQDLEGTQFNPFADLYGWDVAARRASQLAAQHGSPTLAVHNWTLASRIAWYARPLPVKVIERHLDQYGLWFGVLQPGESALLVDWSQLSFAPPVGPGLFERCDLLEQQSVTRLGRQITHFNFLLCHNWQGPQETALDRRP